MIPADEESRQTGKRWQEASAALDHGESERAVELFRELADGGDWRAASAIGSIYESRGPDDPRHYIQAAHWYSNALAKEDTPQVRRGLARYYYYGLGGTRDYSKALEHLERAAPDDNAEASLMLATLLVSGAGEHHPTLRERSATTRSRGLLVIH